MPVDDPLHLVVPPVQAATPVVLAILLAVIVALVGTGLVLVTGESRARAEQVQILEKQVEDMADLMGIWSNEQVRTVRTWAADDDVIRGAEALLAAGREREALLDASAQAELRDHLSTILDVHGYLGYFLVAPDGTSLASSRDDNTGTANLVWLEQPQRLAEVFEGEAVVTVPQISDVPLPGTDSRLEATPTMFSAAPILGDDGAVIAALLFRLDAGRSFSEEFKGGEWRTTGEIIAFDDDARLLVPSRFQDRLDTIGVTAEGALGSVRLVDPGVDLRAEPAPPDLADRPLTTMAASAVAGGIGTDGSGYRSYLGYEVLGAWRWEPRLGYGIAAERSVDEALAQWSFVERSILVLAGVMIALLLGVGWFLALSRPRLRRDRQLAGERARRLRTVLDQSSDGLVMVAPDHRVVLANEAADRLFGVEPGGLVGSPIDNLLRPSSRPGHAALIDGFFAGPPRRGPMARLAQSVPARRADGTTFPVAITLSSIELDGGTTVALATIRDLTTDEALAQQQQLMRELERLTVVGTHDLQEPLRKVETLSDLLRLSCQERLDDEGGEVLGRLLGAVERTRSLVQDLTTYITASTAELHRDRVDLGELVGERLASIESEIDAAGIEVTVGDLGVVWGDREQLRRVFGHLIDNALTFRGAEPTLRVYGRYREGEELSYEVTVADNGIGFAQEYAEQVFDVFRRLQRSGGNGIGLAVCRRVVERHGGTIRARSTPGEGTRITVVLPAFTERTFQPPALAGGGPTARKVPR